MRGTICTVGTWCCVALLQLTPALQWDSQFNPGCSVGNSIPRESATGETVCISMSVPCAGARMPLQPVPGVDLGHRGGRGSGRAARNDPSP